MIILSKKYSYSITINAPAKKGSNFTYSFGNTQNVQICIGKNSVSSFFQLTVKKTHEELLQMKLKLLRDVLRKSYLLFAIINNKSLEIKTINISVDNDIITYDSNSDNFPYVFSMLNSKDFGLTNEWQNEKLYDYIIHSTKTSSDWDYKNCAIQAFLLGKSRNYETDKFLNFWTAMNSVYNFYADLFEESECLKRNIERSELGKYRAKGIDNASLGILGCILDSTFFMPKKPENIDAYKIAYKETSRYLKKIKKEEIGHLYFIAKNYADKTSSDNGNYNELFDLADTMGISLYLYLLLIYPYYLRCNYFHGSKVQPVISAYNDPEILDLNIINRYLELFLNHEIPKIIRTNTISENDMLAIESYMEKRKKSN